MASTRRLAAILAADVAGYSRLMGADEEGTLAALKAIRRELSDPKVKEHRGRIVKTTGDGLLIEFPSVVDAVRCAVEVQERMAARNVDVPEGRRIEFRMGINLGDIIRDERDIYGDGVNIAARLEALAEPGGICVSRVVRDQVRDKVDLTFADMGDQQVKNIARPVHVWRLRLGAKSAASSPTALALPVKPSIAVLPFQNMSGDPEQEYFVDGMVEEITTAIAKMPWLFVIARNSSFTYKGKAVDVKQVARELGVRYVVEGSARKSGNRVRITGQLIDTASGAHIWADRFDGALEDVFELQDHVASGVAGAIEPKLLLAEMERAARKPTESLDAYDLYLRALSSFHRLTVEGHREAIRLSERALELDPSYWPAMAMIGWCRVYQAVQGWVVPTGAEVAQSVALARQSIEAGKDDPDVLWMAGFTVSHLAGEHALAIAAVERALVLNPNCAHAWMVSGYVRCFSNRLEEAIESIYHALRLSPLDPLAYLFRQCMALAHLAAGRYEEATIWIDQSLGEQPRFLPALRVKVAVCGYLGQEDEGKRWLGRLLELNPGLTVAGFDRFAATFLSPGVRAQYLEGMRRAGLPAG
jgi:TolB-like protein